MSWQEGDAKNAVTEEAMQDARTASAGLFRHLRRLAFRAESVDTAHAPKKAAPLSRSPEVHVAGAAAAPSLLATPPRVRSTQAVGLSPESAGKPRHGTALGALADRDELASPQDVPKVPAGSVRLQGGFFGLLVTATHRLDLALEIDTELTAVLAVHAARHLEGSRTTVGSFWHALAEFLQQDLVQQDAVSPRPPLPPQPRTPERDASPRGNERLGLENASLKAELGTLRHRLVEAEANRQASNARLADKEREAAEAAARQAEVERRAGSDCAALQSQLAALRQQLAAAEAGYQGASAQLAAKHAEAAAVESTRRAEIDAMAAQLAATRSQAAESADALQAAVAELASARRRAEELAAEREAAAAELARTRREAAESTAGWKAAEEQLGVAGVRARESKQTVETLGEEVTQLRQQLAYAQAQPSQQEEAMRDMVLDNAKLTSQVSDLNRQLQDTQALLANSRGELESQRGLAAAHQSIGEELGASRAEAADLRVRLEAELQKSQQEDWPQRLETLSREMEDKVSAARREADSAREQADAAQSQVDASLEMQAGLVKQLEAAQAELQASQKHVLEQQAHLTKQYGDLEASLAREAELEKRLVSVESRLSSLKVATERASGDTPARPLHASWPAASHGPHSLESHVRMLDGSRVRAEGAPSLGGSVVSDPMASVISEPVVSDRVVVTEPASVLMTSPRDASHQGGSPLDASQLSPSALNTSNMTLAPAPLSPSVSQAHSAQVAQPAQAHSAQVAQPAQAHSAQVAQPAQAAPILQATTAHGAYASRKSPYNFVQAPQPSPVTTVSAGGTTSVGFPCAPISPTASTSPLRTSPLGGRPVQVQRVVQVQSMQPQQPQHRTAAQAGQTLLQLPVQAAGRVTAPVVRLQTPLQRAP